MNKIIYAIAVMFLICVQACGGNTGEVYFSPTSCAPGPERLGSETISCVPDASPTCAFDQQGSQISVSEIDSEPAQVCNCRATDSGHTAGVYYCISVNTAR